MSKHTPGPWAAHMPPFARPFITCEAPGHGSTGILADISFNDNQQANARLIAAAPELLEALRDVLRIANAASIGVAGNQPRLERARAAIAKAAGE